MEENQCFICSDICSNDFYLINLQTKKFKTKYTNIIGNLINSEYELVISHQDKVCEKCSVLIEKYDEVNNEAQTFMNVISRQIANTYSIESDYKEPVYLDKSKIFSEIRSNGGNGINVRSKYSCKICPRFVTDNIDTVNSHVLYHQITSQDPHHNSTNSNSIASSTTILSKAKSQPAREGVKTANKNVNNITEVPQVTKSSVPFQMIGNYSGQEFNEESLDSIIDLNLLDDEFYDSNLKQNNCLIDNCSERFIYACDYVRHLQLSHRLAQNQIFDIVKNNLKRPSNPNKFTCPYCFSKISSSEQLESHVTEHENAMKISIQSERISQFISKLLKLCRCTVCDCEILDPTVLKCNHEIFKNGMAPKLNCNFCDEYFYSDKLYNNHLALVHGYCFICESTCGDKTVLRDHIRSHLCHSEYACPFCKDIYQTKMNRLNHIRLKHIMHCCSHCEEWYVKNPELEHHIRFAHADKRSQKQRASVCDSCGSSFKNKQLYERHIQSDHKQKRVFKCTICPNEFQYLYMLMEHIKNIHNRTVVDSGVNFYKCCFCTQGYLTEKRSDFLEHLNLHKTNSYFCYDCNTMFEVLHLYESHREKLHQDFSLTVDKVKFIEETPKPDMNKTVATKKSFNLPVNSMQPVKTVKKLPKQMTVKKQTINNFTAQQQKPQQIQISTPSPKPTLQQPQFEVATQELQQQEQQTQQIMIQSDDGSLLNMNNLILTENGELIIQNLDGLVPNGQDDGAQIQIDNLEQFLMEQGLTANTEISYIQSDSMITDDGQVIIENHDDTSMNQSSQDSLLQTYKEIFEPDDELIGVTEVQQSQNILLNGEYLIQTPEQKTSITNNVQQQTMENVDAANQSTLDELGDILLEVAAAAEKEKKPKVSEQKALRETLWGKKRNLESVKESSVKRRSGKSMIEPAQENETPARDFSQAYEFFVRGFDAKKQKQL